MMAEARVFRPSAMPTQGIKGAMESLSPRIAEVHGMLLAMLKNLECPICLEVIKEPVSTNCAHIFCRFCTVKLFKQKKGVTQCPLCNAKVTKRSLQEDVRFKQVIEGVLETVHAFERDTGLKFADDQCFPKKAIATASASVPQKEQPFIDSKGYRNRLKNVKGKKKGNTSLGENSNLPPGNGIVTRHSLRNKRNSNKAISLEIGSDSSEDLFKKAHTVRCVDFESDSGSQDDGCTKKQSPSLCHIKLTEPSAEDVAPLDILGACGFLEEGLGSTEGTQENTGNVEVEENGAVEKSQSLFVPDPFTKEHDSKSYSRSVQEDEATKTTTDKRTSNNVETVGIVLPAGIAQTCAILSEVEQQQLQTQASPDIPLSQVSGKKLRQSIQKVNEWLSKSKKSAHTEEVAQDLDPRLLNVDSPSSQKDKRIEEEELTICDGDRLLSKPISSKIEDKIFGKTYKRERKSTPRWNEKKAIQISTEEGTAVNIKSCDTPVRKTLMRKRKASSELTPEDFIRRQDVKASIKRPGEDEDPNLEEGGQGYLANKSPVPEEKEAEFPAEPVKKGVSILKADTSNSAHLRTPKKRTNSLSKRNRQLVGPVAALQSVMDRSSRSPGKDEMQIDSYPSSEEPKEEGPGQKQIRRSRRLQVLTEEAQRGDRRLQLHTEGTWREREPAKRGKKQVEERERKQSGSQVGNISSSPSVADDDPTILQGRLQEHMPWLGANLMGMEDAADKVCTNPTTSPSVLGVVKGTPTVEQTAEDKQQSPPCIVPNDSQGSCSLLQLHSRKVRQKTFEDKQFKAVPQSEKSASCAQELKSDGFCTRDMTESYKVPKTGGKAGALELNPETDDSELETGFMRKIFSRCKRQSFLLHPSPMKESAAEIQREPSTDCVQDSKSDCVRKSVQDVDRIYEERGQALTCEVTKGISVQSLSSCTSSFPEHESRTEHFQVALQAPSPDHPSIPVRSASKRAEGRNQLQSINPGSEKEAPPEMGETANMDGSSRSPSLSPINEINSYTDCFQGIGPEGAENKRLALSSQPELVQLCPEACQQPRPEFSSVHTGGESSTMEQKQLKSSIEQAIEISSPGIPRCLASGDNLEQSTEREFHSFPLLSETPKGSLGPGNEGKKSPSNFGEMGKKGILAVFAKTDEETPHKRDLNSSNGSKSKCKGLVRACRRLVRKLSSSEEESSSEDEELPCFQALIFDQSASTPLQAMKEKEKSAEILAASRRSHLKPKDKEASLSQESGYSVNLFSSQSHASEDDPSKFHDSGPRIPASTGNLTSSSMSKKASQTKDKVSRDAGQLKDGCQEHMNAELNLGEETMDYDSEASHMWDSSGLSSQSETLTTQQRDAMQNNLKELQQKMAILEAVLQETQSDDSKELPLPCDKSRKDQKGGVASLVEANSENWKTSNSKESLSELPATPEYPINSKYMDPVVQQCQNAHESGSTAKLRPRSKQRLTDALPPARSVHSTPGRYSTSISKSEEHTLSCLATRGSPAAAQDTDQSSATRHKAQGRPHSSLAPITHCSSGKANPKSSLFTITRNMSLVASGLKQGELRLVQKFARKTESAWSNKVTEETTHVVMKTDEDLVCERTLKYFLGIAARKWVVSYQWIVQSLKEGRVLDEEEFEVRGDVINGRSHQGPKRARESHAGKLFQGLEICCYGPFTDLLPEQLEWMVELCGASLVKQPHLFACATNSAAVVVVQPDAWVEDAGCQEFLLQCNATVVAREWVLDSVACYQRRMFDDYIVQQAKCDDPLESS
ncbi:breast cancer type 1 susceptibility protein isoform X2 [Hemicordylus capensis]|uniref:breast cancer type 1 susceptibility protein isoform X2 n=1 Tax=Hemicordylus capensis TaxID=884348 RepID=UPI0023031867|nr:breast cancer type 1 susceptibility protein isoform X2 [Hemicordylus capensis]